MATMNDLSACFYLKKNDLYNCLKSHKVWQKLAKQFLRYLAKAHRYLDI